MTTDALDKALDTIRAEEAVRSVRRTQEPLVTCVYIIAEATWDASLHPSHEDYLNEGTLELRDRIMKALDAQGLSWSKQWVYVWHDGDRGPLASEGLVEWLFTAR